MLTINKNKNKKLSGFTLLELIVVIAIIAILAVIAIPSFNKALEKSRLSAIKSDIANLTKAIEVYAANNGGYYNQKTIGHRIGFTESADDDNSGGTWGNCNSVSFKNTAFADPEVKKLIATLNNKIYDAGSFLDWWAWNTTKRIFCSVSPRDVNHVSFILWNIDQKNTGVCWDSTGFYNGYDYNNSTDKIYSLVPWAENDYKCGGFAIAPAGVNYTFP